MKSEFAKEEALLKDCPVCGSRPTIYAGAASEPYGRSIQTMSIDCSNTKGQHCIHGVAIETDTDVIRKDILKHLSILWNSIEP